MKFKSGVLLIGSLLWDDNLGEHLDFRKIWREKQLNSDSQISCLAPICYGRKSGVLGYHTMVLSSQILENNQLGIVKAIPFKNKYLNITELLENVKLLSLAEGNYKADKDKEKCPVVKGDKEQWAVISYLLNPELDSKRKEHFRLNWKNLTNISSLDFHKYNEFAEKPIIDKNGEIHNYWPSAINSDDVQSVNSFDVLFVTCTKINRNGFPCSNILANEFRLDPRKYILNNINNGIISHQDIAILNFAQEE